MKVEDCKNNMELICKSDEYASIERGEKITVGAYFADGRFSQNGYVYHLEDFEPVD